MRAISLIQPWAGLVASGIKLIENRDRPIISPKRFGETFGIHASSKLDPAIYDRIRQIAPELFDGDITEMRWYQLSRITGAVIAVATIDSLLDPVAHGIGHATEEARAPLPPDQRRWFFGPLGYTLRDVRALAEPVRCLGALSNWAMPDNVARAVTAQVTVQAAVIDTWGTA
jgi:hypothetical protein